MVTENKTKIHTVYKLSDGSRVPSVTTILGILNKPALLDWAWRCGVEGKDYKAVRDNAADIGTLAHGLVMAHLTKTEFDKSEYSSADIDKAENCLIKYFDWEKGHKIEVLMVETPMLSETYRFGGTIDCLAKVDGELALIDHKTGKGIYSEMFYQLAAYRQLLRENGHVITNARILRIGRDSTEGFEERMMVDLDKQFELFLACLKIYRLQAELRG
jgi:hypothetical protein